MSFVTIEPHNSVFVKVYFSDRHSATSFKDIVSEVMPLFHVLKKNPANYRRWKNWDGKVSYYNLNNGLLNTGLITDLTKFCLNRNINIIDNRHGIRDTFYDKYLDKYIEKLNIHKFNNVTDSYEEINPDKNQIKAFRETLERKTIRMQLATGGGKSLYSYCLVHYLMNHGIKKIVVVVPRQDLANQLYTEYADYSKFDNKFDMNNISVIHSKSKHDINNKIIFITFQSMIKLSQDFFENIDVLIVDEAHKAGNNSLRKIIESCINTQYKIGMSGTFEQKEDFTSDLCLQALFGDIVNIANQRDLITMKRASDFEGRFYILKHTDYDVELLNKLKKEKDKIREKEYKVLSHIKNKNIEDIQEKINNINTGKCHGDLAYLSERLDFLQNTYIQTKSKKWGYMDEVEFLNSCEARNKFILNTALNNTKGNSLIVFSRIEKHGDVLLNMLKQEIKHRNLDVDVFYIHGKSDIKPDEAKKLIEKSKKRCIILANIQMVREGWSVNNLHFCYLACTLKKPSALIQLAGRLLRKDGTDIKTALFSILDDIPIDAKNTYSYQHGLVNMQTIINENHNVKQKKVDLNQYFKKD